MSYTMHSRACERELAAKFLRDLSLTSSAGDGNPGADDVAMALVLALVLALDLAAVVASVESGVLALVPELAPAGRPPYPASSLRANTPKQQPTVKHSVPLRQRNFRRLLLAALDKTLLFFFLFL